MDLDVQRLRYAYQHLDSANLARGNLQHIPFPSNAVDLVIALEVLEHVGQAETALYELQRVTRRWAIISVPNEPFWRIGNMARGAYWSAWGQYTGTYQSLVGVGLQTTSKPLF